MPSLLSGLKFTTVERPVKAVGKNPTESRRAKLATAIDEQINLANGVIQKKPFVVTKTNKSGIQVQKRIKDWFFPKDGSFYTAVNYGPKPLKFKGGIHAGPFASLKEVVAVLETIKQAVLAGELDQAIATAAERKLKSK